MHFNTLSSILRGIWLLDPAWAELHAPLVARLLNGEDVSFSPYRTNDNDADIFQMAADAYNIRAGNTSFSAPDGSVAVLDINGPLIRYSEGMCGLKGMEDMAKTVRAVNASSQFVAGVLNMNCPGGQASGTSMLGEILAGSNKPWITCIQDGIAASGGMWLASQTREIWVTNKQSSVGSIGAYCTLTDHSERMAKKGIKVHEIYAPQSTDKNKEYRDALAGDYSAIQGHLGELVDQFTAAVKNGRGERLNEAAGNPFTGKMYNAKEAKKLGLIDGMKSMDEVIARAKKMGTATPTTQKSSNNKMSTKKDTKYPAIAAAAGWANGYEVTEEGLHITNEDAAAVNTALEQGATDAATVATNATTIAGHEATIKEQGEQITKLTNELTTAKADADTQRALATKYGAQSANTGTTTTTTKDVETEAPKQAAMDPVTAEAMGIYAKNRNKAKQA